VLIAACATAKAPPPPRLPQWKAIPSVILDSLCANFRDEGISTSGTINLVITAQPALITPMSMDALSTSFFYRGPLDASHAAAAAAAEAVELPIGISRTCAWRGIAAKNVSNYADTLTLEISPPIVNPFARSAAGLFARIALGNESPTWYWLPLIPRGDSWIAGRLTVLPYRQ
jgi:hypothetical protein